MSASRPSYIGRLARRRGTRALVDVVALEGKDGWEVIDNPRRLFPKVGQVEFSAPQAVEGFTGEWLAFQVVEDGRPGAKQIRVTTHRFLPRFADVRDLGSIEAARFLFTREGWDGASNPGHWAIQFSADQVLALHLDRSSDGRLRCMKGSFAKIPCFAFDPAKLKPEPAGGTFGNLYDWGDAVPLDFYDWSAGADYVAHVVRALAGANDPRLPELITWLELHRDDVTGRVSAIGTEHEVAFEALRSGELAARLSADREVMADYFAAVREDPQVAQALAQAIAHEAEKVRADVRATLEREIAEEIDTRRVGVMAELASSQQKAEAELRAQMIEREREATAELERGLDARRAAFDDEVREQQEAASRELESIHADIAKLISERDTVGGEVNRLRELVARHEEAARVAASRLSSLEGQIVSAAGPAAVIARPLAVVPSFDRGDRIDRAELGRRIARCVLLTPTGKESMAAFAAYLFAGEVPVLEGPGVEDFVLVAEALLAAGRLVPFDADQTIITAEDLWSRPGSSVPSQVAQAASEAAEGRTFLVQLRGIDRSGARAWHPALAALARRGMLPRPLLMFATLADPASEEAHALPPRTCRMTIEAAVVEEAALVAPSLLGSAANAIASYVELGEFPADLSSATAVIALLGDIELDLTTTMRIARIAIEAAAIAPDNVDAMLSASQQFCRDIRHDEHGHKIEGETKHA